jgi:hypothetical protein
MELDVARVDLCAPTGAVALSGTGCARGATSCCEIRYADRAGHPGDVDQAVGDLVEGTEGCALVDRPIGSSASTD